MDLTEKTVNKKYIYNGKILNLRVDDILLPDGKPAKREIIEHSGGSAVYCEKDGKVLFVRQFRYPYKKVIYEIPAGKINAGEKPEATAIRELEEECGVKAEKVTETFKIYPSPGYTEEIIYIYKAEGLKDTSVRLDDGEYLSSCWIEKDEAIKMVENGEIKDAKTVIALLNERKQGK